MQVYVAEHVPPYIKPSLAYWEYMLFDRDRYVVER